MSGLGKQQEKIVHGGGIVLVPAVGLVEFLDLNMRDGLSIHSFECLYELGVGTRPSMELSATVAEFASRADFIAFARDAATRALAVAASENSVAVFEICFDERLLGKGVVA